MSSFFARRQYNTPILYIGVQRIACTDIEAAPNGPGRTPADRGFAGKVCTIEQTTLVRVRYVEHAEKVDGKETGLKFLFLIKRLTDENGACRVRFSPDPVTAAFPFGGSVAPLSPSGLGLRRFCLFSMEQIPHFLGGIEPMGLVFRFTQPVVFCVGALLILTGILHAQDALPIPAPSTPYVGIPEDWSTQHVIYTRNGSAEDMLKVRDDPRFLNSVLLHYMRERRSQDQPPASAGLNEAGEEENGLSEDRSDTDNQDLQAPSLWGRPRPTPPPRKHSKIDWAVSLGAAGGISGTAVAESPAKYSFSTSGVPHCSDFVVYLTSANNVKVGTQADLVGLTNLYSGTSPTGICGSAPTFLFSYAIVGTTGTGKYGSSLSPVLSLDGAKIAWIQGGGTNAATLHVTTWATGSGQGTNATTGSVDVNGASSDVVLAYTAASGCTGSLKTDSDSDMYVDYPSDTAFVSADNGILYDISGIFHGTPTVKFCITVNASAGAYMGGAVYDSLLNEVFITDSSTVYAYTVGASSFTLAASKQYAASSGSYATSAPLLDAFAGFIYMFTLDDNEATAHTSVAQLPTNLASVVYVPLGPIGNTTPNVELTLGAFDNNYYNFGPANAASTLYSCGTDATTNSAQDLFAIKFIPATGVVNTTPAMAANKHVNPGGASGICSPITEFFDGTTDRIFVGMGDYNAATTGANVVQMWVVTNQLTSTADTYTAEGTGYQGGTSGFTVDNYPNPTSYAQAESVYFYTLAESGSAATCGASLYCAVKLTQSGLQ
jgi:hypothetical protein